MSTDTYAIYRETKVPSGELERQHLDQQLLGTCFRQGQCKSSPTEGNAGSGKEDPLPSLSGSSRINRSYLLISSIPFSCSVMSDSLWLHGLQHARLPCPSPTSSACSNSCPLSQWCHPTILSSVVPFSSCLQSFPASQSFPVSQFFASGCQSIGASASASVLPVNIQDWFPLGLI